MNFKQLFLIGLIGLMCTFLIRPQKITAKENEEDLIIECEINDPQLVEQIKEAILKDYALHRNLNISQEDINRILADSELRLNGFDLSSPTAQDVLATLSIQSSAQTAFQLSVPVSIIRKVTIFLKDTTAPDITLLQQSVSLSYGDVFDPMQWVEITDNSLDENPVLSIENPVDTKNYGTYTVSYKAEDASGNIAVKQLEVIVSSNAVASNSDQMIAEMLALINDARAETGLKALTLADDAAQRAAALRAQEAAATNASHTRPDGSHYKTALDEYGVSYYNPLEILTYSGYTVYDKFNWWMNSTNHHDILMDSSGNRIAIGYSGEMWCAIVFTD